MGTWFESNNTNKLRVIKTARTEVKINKAALNGFKPLIKKIVPLDEIRSKYTVYQNKLTGEIVVSGDYRGYDFIYYNESEYEKVIDWSYYYPHAYKLPFAAYLIPDDIKAGERVFIKDLIEDFVGARWNQGDTYRLESCEAIWNGADFEIQFNPETDCSSMIG